MDTTEQKRAAARHAADQVQSGMIVGLGVGSTAAFAVERVAERLREGSLSDILGIPCSNATEAAAREFGIPLTTLDAHPVVDLTIDGADEVDRALNLIKGGGGALLREKIVAQASRRVVIAVDACKLAPHLGVNWYVPVEVIPFALGAVLHYLEAIGGHPSIRTHDDGALFRTDEGNVIVKCAFGPLPRPRAVAAQLDGRAGIVEHGLFLGLATEVVVAGPAGIRVLRRRAPRREA